MVWAKIFTTWKGGVSCKSNSFPQISSTSGGWSFLIELRNSSTHIKMPLLLKRLQDLQPLNKHFSKFIEFLMYLRFM